MGWRERPWACAIASPGVDVIAFQAEYFDNIIFFSFGVRGRKNCVCVLSPRHLVAEVFVLFT